MCSHILVSTSPLAERGLASRPSLARRTAGQLLDAPDQRDYLGPMASIMTIQEQRRAGAAARKVGGYSEIIRLESERRKAGGNGHVVRDTKSGRYTYERAADSKPKK